MVSLIFKWYFIRVPDEYLCDNRKDNCDCCIADSVVYTPQPKVLEQPFLTEIGPRALFESTGQDEILGTVIARFQSITFQRKE